MKKLTGMILMLGLLAGCGSDDAGAPGFGNGRFRNQYIDNNIVAQIPCQSISGTNSRTTVGFRIQNGQVTNIQSATIPNPVQTGFSNTFLGRTSYGDVVVEVQNGTGRDVLISLCHRGYISSPTVTNAQISDFTRDPNTYCGYAAIISGYIGLDFQATQNTGYPQYVDLYPRPLDSYAPIPDTCFQGQQQYF